MNGILAAFAIAVLAGGAAAAATGVLFPAPNPWRKTCTTAASTASTTSTPRRTNPAALTAATTPSPTTRSDAYAPRHAVTWPRHQPFAPAPYPACPEPRTGPMAIRLQAAREQEQRIGDLMRPSHAPRPYVGSEYGTSVYARELAR